MPGILNAPTPKWSYYIYDHLGNTRVVYKVDLSDICVGGDVTIYTLENVEDYFPYGKRLRGMIGGNGEEKFLTTQHERDKETGLDYRGARFYDADIARFLSLDPLAADFAEWSAYNYVLANPIIFIDPTGREPEESKESEEEEMSLWNANHLWLNSTFNGSVEEYKQVKGQYLIRTSETIFELMPYAESAERNANKAKVFAYKVNKTPLLISKTSKTNTIVTVLEIPYNYSEQGSSFQRTRNSFDKQIKGLTPKLREAFRNASGSYDERTGFPSLFMSIPSITRAFYFAEDAKFNSGINLGYESQVRIIFKPVPCLQTGSGDCQARKHKPSQPFRIYFEFYGKQNRA